jgi:hypothetical protein
MIYDVSNIWPGHLLHYPSTGEIPAHVYLVISVVMDDLRNEILVTALEDGELTYLILPLFMSLDDWEFL